MPKIIIFMNEQLHAKKPKHGVITVKQGRRKWHGNRVCLSASANLYSYDQKVERAEDGLITVAAWSAEIRFDPRGCRAIRTHKVVAWIEVD